MGMVAGITGAAAMQRVESVLKRRPEVGLHGDAPATPLAGGQQGAGARGGRLRAVHSCPELGVGGDQVKPGWLFRAGLASCFATRIAMQAAAAEIELTMLEVVASSRSDARGLFGMAEVSGEPVGAGPRDVQLFVKISAPGVAAERLQSLVEDCNSCSPVSAAVRDAVPVTLRIEVHA